MEKFWKMLRPRKIFLNKFQENKTKEKQEPMFVVFFFNAQTVARIEMSLGFRNVFQATAMILLGSIFPMNFHQVAA